jgi:hypothetical protein
MRTGHRILLIVAFAAISVSVLSCSRGAGANPPAGLQKALASTPATSTSRARFEYGSPAALRELGVLHPTAPEHNRSLVDPKWSRVMEVGTGALGSVSSRLAHVLSLDVYAADTAVTIGKPPDTATEIDGSLDASTITARLRALGARPRTFGGVDGLSFGRDNTIDPEGDVASDLHVTDQLDQVTVSDDRFAASPNSTALQRILDEDQTALLDTAAYRGMAHCLGDVLAAVITNRGDRRVSLIGVGIRTPASATATRHEIVCFRPRPGAVSSVVSSARTNAIPDDIASHPDARRSGYLAHAAVTATGEFVRIDLTMRPNGVPGLVLELLDHGTVHHWDGACGPTRTRTC